MHVNGWGSQWRMGPPVTRDASALLRTVAVRLRGRRAWGLAVAWTAGWLPGASTHKPRASLQTALLGAEHRRVMPVPIGAWPWENFCISAEQGRARSPRVRGACRCGLLLARPSRALPEAAPRLLAPPASRAVHQITAFWRDIRQNGLISTVHVGKIDPISFISSESVIKCAGDSWVGNIFCYNIFHLPGAGSSGCFLSPRSP